MSSSRLVVGCMSGTSLDGLDAALVEIEGHGLGMRARLLNLAGRPLGTLGPVLRKLAEQHPMSAGEIVHAMSEFALLHVAVIRECCGQRPPDLICAHGQTVFHAPPHSWQMLQPAPIARVFGCPVVFDLRAADLAAGGQGAPITPLADLVLFGEAKRRQAIVNLGGFCNVTLLPATGGGDARAWNDLRSQIAARDVCACNHVLDLVAREKLGCGFDADGALAATAASVDREALEDLSSLFGAQGKSGRSLGTGDELQGWLTRHDHVPGAVLALTACSAIAKAIGDACEDAEALVLAGGGARHRTLVNLVRERCKEQGQAVTTTAEFGMDVTAREAACFAVLGALCQDGVPITLPQVTGVKVPPVCGAWVYPPGGR